MRPADQEAIKRDSNGVPLANTDDPCACAVRALDLLYRAERAFPFAGDGYRRALDEARREIGAWSVGMVADMDRDI